MALSAQYNYLSRIGALSLMAINVLLRVVIVASSLCRTLPGCNRFEQQQV